MIKQCVVCDKSDSKYKCPTCFLSYCSNVCCRKHRSEGCQKPLENVAQNNVTQTNLPPQRYLTEDTVPVDKLKLLDNDKELKELLHNPHLRNLLVTIDTAENPEKIMEKAMQEPLFIEFADACLKLVEPLKDDES